MVYLTFLLIISSPSCGMKDSAHDDPKLVKAALESKYKYHYCGTLNVAEDGVVVLEVNQNTKYTLYPMNKKAKSQLEKLPDSMQGCVFGHNPPGSLFDTVDLDEIGFRVEFMGSGVDLNIDCNCPSVYSPVCDTHNHKTYSNSCKASCDGVYHAEPGPCFN